MIKESIDSLESKLGKRKEFLFDNDLDRLQKEFLANKEKCSVKIIKKAPNKKENEININNLIFPTGEIKKKKGKKKVKDVISLNLPPLINDNEINNKNQNKSENISLFSLNYNKIEEKNKANDTNNNPININITTGLPDTFKIEEIKKESNIKSEKDNNILIKENEKNEIKNDNDIIKEEEFKSKEYDEINKENQKRIEQMSKDEIMEAQKEIFAAIPSDLLEKFKSNFFSQQIKKSLHQKEENILKDIKSEENKNIEKNVIKEINSNINNNLDKKDNIETKKENEEIILFSYEGNMKKENKEKYLIDNPEMKDSIDYRFLTFLLKKKYHLTLDIFINQIDSLFNKLYYMVNSSNINIKSESLKCIEILYHDFFYEDYKIFRFNAMLMGLYPSIIYFNFINMNKNLQEQKKICIKSIQENGYENINEYINILRNGGINDEINNSLLILTFYTIYVCEKIPCKLNKIFEINFDILSKNQKLLKLIAILCDYEEFGKNINFFDKLIKNKNFLKYLVELRGLGKLFNTILIDKNNVKNSLKNKIYDLNYLLLFNNNNSISYDIYSKEKNYLLLSKILQLKIFYCLNTENNMENDNYLPIVNSDIELNFWTDKFRECIKKLKEKENNLNCYELMSIYKYISVFLYLWSKVLIIS